MIPPRIGIVKCRNADDESEKKPGRRRNTRKHEIHNKRQQAGSKKEAYLLADLFLLLLLREHPVPGRFANSGTRGARSLLTRVHSCLRPAAVTPGGRRSGVTPSAPGRCSSGRP